jgi:hypothetical protein
VKGLSRVPKPAARTIAFFTIFSGRRSADAAP